jgi:hypothetical protein
MSYKSIIVNLAVDAPTAPIVKVGIELAERFGARLIGLAAADVPPLVATGDGMVYEGEIMQIQRTEIEKRLAELRAEFERLVASRAHGVDRGIQTLGRVPERPATSGLGPLRLPIAPVARSIV